MTGILIIGNNLPGLQLQSYPQHYVLTHNSFMTLFDHNFTNLPTYSETYLNGLQNDMLTLFGFLFELKPQLIFHSCKSIILFFSDIKIYITIVIMN